jgi:patatin-like phospholipase/acyl hydrolase
MSEASRFQILALSGGGFRGLYTARILADIEQHIREPIARKFDLIAGTSIGGILALALAREIPASEMVALFERHGGAIFKKRFTPLGFLRASYDPSPLRDLLSGPALFGDRLLGSCKHRVIIPSINYTSGQPVTFKTPHAASFVRDHTLRLVDIALATSAAPMYFPRHVFGNSQYVDGGLFANAPGLLALHEAETVLGQAVDDVHLLSIGTMSSLFTVNPKRNRAGGTLDWGGIFPANTPKRLFGLAISVQESITNSMLKHRLTDKRYLHVDDILSNDKAHAVALDKTDHAAREALLGSATEQSKRCLGNDRFMQFLKHTPTTPVFYHGENAAA